MVTTTSSQVSDTTSVSRLSLDTIPSEIRAIIYTHVCNPICLEVDSSNKLITTDYPWQLSVVSHLIKDEFLPRLLGESTIQPLHLICQDGRFPDNIRRRIPNRVLYGISSITICGSLKFDELKVSPATFPNLRELWLYFPLLSFPLALAKLWNDDFPEEETVKFIQTVKRRILMEADKLKRELEMPREGLEKDYIVDGTLFEVLETRRERRGFDVKVLLTLSYVNKKDSGILTIDSWDKETCTSLV